MTARIQNAGLARFNAALLGLSWCFGWGTGGGALASANDLIIPASEARVMAANTQDTLMVTSDTLTMTAKLTATGFRAITEFGAFDSATGGNMDVYVEMAGEINLKAGDAIVLTLSLSLS